MMNLLQKFALVFSLCLLASGLSPSVLRAADGFRTYQDAAPEFLEIEILQVSDNAASSGALSHSFTPVDILARVIDVHQSRSNLRPGMDINIRYRHRMQAGTTPPTPEPPMQGDVVNAFLRQRGSHYEPAAFHLTFEPMTDSQRIAWDQRMERRRPLQTRSPVAETRTEVTEIATSSEAEIDTALTATIDTDIATTEEQLELVPLTPTETISEQTPRAEIFEESVTIESMEIAEPMAPIEVEVQTRQTLSELNVDDTLSIEDTTEQITAATEPEPSMPLLSTAPQITVITDMSDPAAEDATEASLIVEQIDPIDVTNQTLLELAEESSRPAETASPIQPTTVPGNALQDYSRIYDRVKEAENLQFKGANQEALEIYVQSREQLLALQTKHPEFQPFIVQYRLRDLQRRIDRLAKAAE